MIRFEGTMMNVTGKVSKPSGEKGGGRFIDIRLRVPHDDAMYKRLADADSMTFACQLDPKQTDIEDAASG